MMVSVTSLATISFDRMIGVVRPFHTHLKMWQCFVVIIIIWIVSAILAVPFGIYRIYTVGLYFDRCDVRRELCYGKVWEEIVLKIYCKV